MNTVHHRFTLMVLSVLAIASSLLCVSCTTVAVQPSPDTAASLSDSILWIAATTSPYDHYQPWKRSDTGRRSGYGTVVSCDTVLTTAEIVRDAVTVKLKRLGRASFIDATILVRDYEANLCLLRIDPNDLDRPLVPVTFHERFAQGTPVDFFWLAGNNQLRQGRGNFDRAVMRKRPLSFGGMLSCMVSSMSQNGGDGCLYLMDGVPVAIGESYSDSAKEASVISASRIKSFPGRSRFSRLPGLPCARFRRRGSAGPDLASLPVHARIAPPMACSSATCSPSAPEPTCWSPMTSILAIDGVAIDAYGRFRRSAVRQHFVGGPHQPRHGRRQPGRDTVA